MKAKHLLKAITQLRTLCLILDTIINGDHYSESGKQSLIQYNLRTTICGRLRNNNKVTIVKHENDDGEFITCIGIKRATSSSSHEKVKGKVKYEQKEEPSINRKHSRHEEVEVIGWQSHAQLIQFRRMTERIADDYLRELGRTLVPGVTGERATVHDHSMHKIGQKEARNVDLERRRLEAA
ncbi:uncharacterized protein FA14DRAFT_185705 [Meira miltonrushii]|uniref:Uncharacterized protein n=1 Tax=Meira miltonrushii TaxID=1280837 RepID=A0A316V6C7_9BASI|nr:uncharacterized protein FA14DRAFT_185705 [Meira miltonrushii]PWN32804.1 hypothetical protein FA14DRAFT_185705 [Meira miltonrushii]